MGGLILGGGDYWGRSSAKQAALRFCGAPGGYRGPDAF